MIKTAIQYLSELGIKPKERLVKVNERDFVINSEGESREIKPVVYHAQETLRINTLTGVVAYLKAQKERVENNFFVQVLNEETVLVKGVLAVDGGRETLVKAEAIVPSFSFDRFLDTEELIIGLQAKFVKNTDRDILLQVAGNVKEENVRNTGDDGISQSVAIKTGVTTVGDVKVPNPVVLAPYRTFLEVSQPESDFVFRMKDGPRGAIIEADGGAWRNQAITNVREYLAESLKEEIKSGKVTLIA